MSITLPSSITPATTISPKKLIIYSAPKVGKTELAARLEGNLIIDLEDGSDYVAAMKIKIKTYQELHELCEEIKKNNKPYRYGTLDTATALETLCLPLALKLYQQTPMGASYKGPILNLPNGAGYKYLRDAYELMLSEVEGAFERVILLGHVKDKTIERLGKEVQARELDLTGKLSSITCSKADAIGFLYRDGNQNVLTFETANDIICGARPAHLKNKKLVISEMKDGQLSTHWDQVFLD